MFRYYFVYLVAYQRSSINVKRRHTGELNNRNSRSNSQNVSRHVVDSEWSCTHQTRKRRVESNDTLILPLHENHAYLCNVLCVNMHVNKIHWSMVKANFLNHTQSSDVLFGCLSNKQCYLNKTIWVINKNRRHIGQLWSILLLCH